MRIKEFIIILTVSLFRQFCLSQTNETFLDSLNKESLIYISDSLTRHEIASFSIRGKSILEADSSIKQTLYEIPLVNCTDTSAYFEKGDFYASEIIVGIFSENKFSKHRIKEVQFIHYKYGLILPDSAIAGIYDPIFCLNNYKKKKEHFSNCKVFRSSDKKRIYIYMLNGHEKKQYEITWVIQDSKYFTRVLDFVNNE